MSSRILTSHFSGLEEFLQQHAALLAKSTDGTVAVFANNAPAFYALTQRGWRNCWSWKPVIASVAY